jgi:hypothetical protein
MLRSPRAAWVAALVAVLAVALSLPSVSADLYADDLSMVLRLEGTAPTPVPGPFHLYTFLSGEPGERHRFVDHGPLPWWTVDGLRLSFFRPLSSALFAIDHAIAGRHPLPYHLSSIAWYVAAVVLASLLLRRLLPAREAALAAVLFAAAPAHWMIASWPSARHVAVSGAFAIAAIALHLHARALRDAQSPRAPLVSLAAVASAAIGLAGGETALGAFAYVAAFEVLGRRDAVASRLGALAPWGALFVVYAVGYEALGFGVHGSGAYIDPMGQPREYLALLPVRLAVFADAALLGLPSEASILLPHAAPVLATLGVVAVALLAWLLRRAMRAVPEHARTMTWLLAGAALATLPGAAGIPGDRILFLPNVGISAALAIVLLHAGAKESGAALGAWAARAGVAVFGLVHLVLGPLWFGVNGSALASSSHEALAVASRAEIPARDDVDVVGIGLSDPLVGMYLSGSLRVARPGPYPRAVHVLSLSSHDHRVKRTDDRTLEISIVDGTMLDAAFEVLVRPRSAPLRAGDVVPLGAWSVAIVADDGGRPTRFAVTFDRSVDDPSIAILQWKDGALRALPAPPLGSEVLVRHERGPIGI